VLGSFSTDRRPLQLGKTPTVQPKQSPRSLPPSGRESAPSRNLAFDFQRSEFDTAAQPYETFQTTTDEPLPRHWNMNGINIGESLRRALEVCEAAFDDIVDKSADGVVVVNPVGTICFANAAAESMLGRSTGELLGEPFGMPVGAGETFEMKLPSTDQGCHFAEIRVVATHWQGSPALLATLRDVTQRNRALRRRDEFLAMLSHELRNPLAAISSAASVLARPDLDGDAFARARGVIERQCAQMTRLLADLLDVSRATRAKIELRKKCLDLVDVIIEAVDAVRGEAEAVGQTVSLVASVDMIPVDGDAVRLHQVFVNLLSNASKFSGAGSPIRVMVGIEEDQAVVKVRDQGIGMTPEVLEAVFQPFVQLDSSLDRPGEGLGLGLAIADCLIKLHGGAVRASSEGLGKGSEFCVRLPLSRSRPESAPTLADAATETALRVVIVEDNADVGEMLKTLLECVGHQVEIAADGLTGAELIERMHPDVALIDIGLPALNGYQLAQRIRSDDAHRDVYLAALTGYGQAADQEKALSSGFDTHIAKPVSVEHLRRLLASRQRVRLNVAAAEEAHAELPAR
jgi:signal transduction histidine kinase/ActR/RegA family two-component response regulator